MITCSDLLSLELTFFCFVFVLVLSGYGQSKRHKEGNLGDETDKMRGTGIVPCGHGDVLEL